jgi:hypothetical protein
VAALAIAAASARADVVYNDTVDPDLSNDYSNPTALTLPFGTSSLIFKSSLDEMTSILDIDFLQINLPNGGSLAHLYLISDEGTSGTSFLALQAGPAFTFDPLGDNGNDAYKCAPPEALCLGYSHFGTNEAFNGMGIGGDLLVGADEFSGLDDSIEPGHMPVPLTGPQYTFWFQENTGEATFQLDFVVPPSKGDYNHDQTTNAADYTVWRNSLNLSVVAGSGADGNGDGEITPADYTIWKTNYGTDLSLGSGSVVPEPSTCVLLLIGLLASPRWPATRRFGISIPG